MEFVIHPILVIILVQMDIMFLVQIVITLALMSAIVEIHVIGVMNKNHMYQMNVNVLYRVMEEEGVELDLLDLLDQ